ncbi:hypothetical protein EJ110_NYTH01238 [Nymphaea thermarum]|nr:hypothetical protein EJ110_NYTH01238 [Nymphaea thermarum]
MLRSFIYDLTLQPPQRPIIHFADEVESADAVPNPDPNLDASNRTGQGKSGGRRRTIRTQRSESKLAIVNQERKSTDYTCVTFVDVPMTAFALRRRFWIARKGHLLPGVSRMGRTSTALDGEENLGYTKENISRSFLPHFNVVVYHFLFLFLFFPVFALQLMALLSLMVRSLCRLMVSLIGRPVASFTTILYYSDLLPRNVNLERLERRSKLSLALSPFFSPAIAFFTSMDDVVELSQATAASDRAVSFGLCLWLS